ncbi:MAG: hypothetical protein K0U47_02360 [Epsilonproteobacteria bacterium]|nr:hypothetical protein [Campylobacterota bacterium]
MADMDDFRKEFDGIIEQFSGCETNCDTEEEMEEDFPDYIVELKTKMLSPQKCGLYFSKKDIRKIAKECDENISLKQRDRMLNDLLKSIFTPEQMERLFDVIKGYIDLRITYYDELSTVFDASKPLLLPHKEKALTFKKSLDRIFEESNGKVYKF